MQFQFVSNAKLTRFDAIRFRSRTTVHHTRPNKIDLRDPWSRPLADGSTSRKKRLRRAAARRRHTLSTDSRRQSRLS